MKDLVQFLRARMDEDEKIALAVPVISGCVPPAHWGSSAVPGNETYVLGTAHDINAETVEGAAHIRRHDPARVLAEVNAKRLLVDAYDHAAQFRNTPGPGSEQMEGRTDGYEEAVRMIASAWASHPDYRSEWAPDA